ncbi:MAG: family 16 glycoside hydrolase [Verrucomicrobiaceae bacterium]
MKFLSLLIALSLPLLAQDKAPHPGEQLYKINCAACHLLANEVVGPSLVYIAENYPASKDTDFIAWAKAPGKKNPKLIQMPSMAHVPDADLALIHDYLLTATKGVAEKKRGSLFPAFKEPKRPLPYVARTSMPDSSPASIAVVLENGLTACWDTEACRLRYAYLGTKTNLFSMWRPAALPNKPYYRETSAALFPFPGKPEFLGYHLIDQHPVFSYRIGSVQINEHLTSHSTPGAFSRHFQIQHITAPLVLDLSSQGKATLTSDKGIIKDSKLHLSAEDAKSFTLTVTHHNWQTPKPSSFPEPPAPRPVSPPTTPASDPADWNHYYTFQNIPVPATVDHQIGGLTTLRDGRIATCFNSGEIQIYSPETQSWSLFARGLALPLGILEDTDGSLIVTQWAELTRLTDTDQDGLADHYQNLCNTFGITGNYHEFVYGPARDSKGNLYISLNVASNGAGIQDIVRGPWNPIGLERELHIVKNDPKAWEKNKAKAGRMYSRVPYRGWVLQITPDGKTIPFASGFRSPDGIHVDENDRLWITDNQGDWRGTNPLYHVTKGNFYGHPASLVWEKGWTRNPLEIPVEELEKMRTPAAALFPHGELANSPTQPINTIDPELFGLPEGELLIGDMNQPQLIRFLPDEVDGTQQGTLIPFLFSTDLGIGNHRLTFDQRGQLWIGKTHIKWAGDEGIKKITFNKTQPLLATGVSLLPDGFQVTFNRPLKSTPTSQISRHTYHYHQDYGSPKVDLQHVTPTGTTLSADRKTLTITLPQITPRRLYTIELSDATDDKGHPLMGHTLRYNVVKPRPKETAFIDLFQNGDLSQWHTNKKEGQWTIKDGVASRGPLKTGGMGTKGKYQDFELRFEWNISNAGNSGVIYRSGNGRGLEYQILDDQRHVRGKTPNSSAAALYDLVAPIADKPYHPAGQWNKGRIVAKGNHLEHWLNNVKVLEVEIGSPKWKASFQKSKYREIENYGTQASWIQFQDHGADVHFRNVQIRPL